MLEMGDGLQGWTLVSLKRKSTGFRSSQLKSYFLWLLLMLSGQREVGMSGPLLLFVPSGYDLMMGGSISKS